MKAPANYSKRPLNKNYCSVAIISSHVRGASRKGSVSNLTSCRKTSRFANKTIERAKNMQNPVSSIETLKEVPSPKNSIQLLKEEIAEKEANVLRIKQDIQDANTDISSIRNKIIETRKQINLNIEKMSLYKIERLKYQNEFNKINKLVTQKLELSETLEQSSENFSQRLLMLRESTLRIQESNTKKKSS